MWFSSFFTLFFFFLIKSTITYCAFDANNKILWEMKRKKKNCLKYNKVIKMLFATAVAAVETALAVSGGLWLLKYSRKNLFVLSCNVLFFFFFFIKDFYISCYKQFRRPQNWLAHHIYAALFFFLHSTRTNRVH